MASLAYRVSGKEFAALMRRHKVTIRGLAQKHGLTMKRVRGLRAKGAVGFAALELVYLVTGKWIDKAEYHVH